MTTPDRDPLQGAAPGPSTRAVHAGVAEPRPGEPVVTPVVASATFHSDLSPGAEVRYTRYGNNPNHEVVARKLAELEGAEAALVLGSGMAATALTLLTFLGSGDHLVAARSLYGGTLSLVTEEFPRLGITTSQVVSDTRWASALTPNTRALFVEVPVNPTLRIPDIRPLGALARSRGVPLIVDATFATPINFRPLEHGADVVIHSATKFLGGHADVTAGVVAGPADVVDEVRTRMKRWGSVLDPHAAWLLERGIKTLALRVPRQNANALAIAHALEAHPAVKSVHYPGLESHPEHALARELFAGFGGVVSFTLRGGDEAALRVISRLRLLTVAPSLGGVETLVSLPRLTSHAGLTPGQLQQLEIDPGFVRIATGIEDAGDLVSDLEQALAPEVP